MNAVSRLLRASRSSLASAQSDSAQPQQPQQQQQQDHSGSLASLLKDGVENIEDSVTKKWLSWMLKRHVQSQSGSATDEDANAFVDNAVKIYKDLVKSHKLEPMKLADDECVYERKCLFVTLSARVEFSRTELHGLSSFTRRGDAVLTLQEDWLSLETIVVADKITVCSHCRASLLEVDVSFDLTADVQEVDVRLKLRINTNQLQVIVSSLELVNIGAITVSDTCNSSRVMCSGLNVECDDLFPVDSVAAAVSRLFIHRCRDNIVKIIEFEAQCHVETALKHLDLTELIKNSAKSYVKTATDAVRGSLPSLAFS